MSQRHKPGHHISPNVQNHTTSSHKDIEASITLFRAAHTYHQVHRQCRKLDPGDRVATIQQVFVLCASDQHQQAQLGSVASYSSIFSTENRFLQIELASSSHQRLASQRAHSQLR